MRCMKKNSFMIDLLLILLLTSATCVPAYPEPDKTDAAKEADKLNTKADSSLSGNTDQDPKAVQDASPAKLNPIQSSNSQAQADKSSENSSALSTEFLPTQEKLKKELDEFDKDRAAQARVHDKMLEVTEPYSELIKQCEELKHRPFSVTMFLPYSQLGIRYYFKALSSRKYEDAISFNTWLLQAYQKYRLRGGSATALQFAYVADLNSLKGDYAKAEQYCNQYFSSIREADRYAEQKKLVEKSSSLDHNLAALKNAQVNTSKSKSVELLHKELLSLPGVEVWSPAGIIDLAMSRVNYARGDYDKAAQFLAKAKASAPQQKKTQNNTGTVNKIPAKSVKERQK